MFENGKVKATGIHYSRYIASWNNVGGTYGFEEWLESMSEITENERRDILEMQMNGKLELEINAKEFIKKHKLN